MTGSYRDLKFDWNACIILTKSLRAKNLVVRLHPQFALFFRRCIASIHSALLNIELSTAAVRVVNPLILVVDVIYFFQKSTYSLSANNYSFLVKEFKCSPRRTNTHTQFVGNFRFIRQLGARNPFPFRNPAQEYFMNLHI